ncbi:MAG: discoidin domain-containing protein, partial [Clostridia bacterium]|nr:discoidin domain-containing protein [Clostridia bacterium]
MKKALALLLTLAMLATLCTVPVWAEEDVAFDIPVIEEVTEEELEEVVLFTEEEITEEETEGDTNLANVKWKTYVPAEDDGVTYFTEMEGSSVSVFNVVSASTQGNLASITNGIYTTGVEIENPSDNSEVDHYPVVNGAVEGFMGNICKNALTIDLGAEKTFAGIRLVDDHKARAMKARKATRAYISISSDGTNWTTVDRTDVAVARAADYETTYSDFFFKRLNREVNLTARYIRVYVANVNTHGEYDIEEIIMLDADSAKDTYNPVTAKDYYDFDENWEIEVGSNLGGSSAGKLIDGVIFGGQGNCWHSIANAEGHTYTEADKTVTITFDKPTEIGGVRIFPRTDGASASPNTIKLLGTLDGETWYTIWGSKTLGFASNYMEGNEVFFPFGREYPLMGLKVISLAGIDTNMKQYTNYTELQLLKPALPTAQDPDFHVFPDDEVTMGLPMGTFATYGVKEGAADTVIRNTDVGYKAMEGIALTKQYFDNNGKPVGGFSAYQLHHDHCVAGEGATLTGSWKYNTVRAIYDMGKEYEFSGIRFYQRVAGNQNITQFYLSISDDGTNWVKLDKNTLSNAVIATANTLAYGGKTYNYKARYIKIDIAKTASGHWGLEEIRLLNPASGVDTKSPTALLAELEAMKGDVKAVIDAYEPYNVEIEDATAISAAKAKFDKLSSEDQATLDGDKLDKLYDAATQLSHNVRVNKYGLTDPSATNHNGQKGYKNVSYTLYVNDVEGEDPVTVTGISYLGEAISNNYDRWTAVNNGDGTVTLTLGGNYWNDPDWKNWIEGPMTASIKSYEDTEHYYRTVNKIDNYSTDPVEIRPESFTGTLVREITMKDEGDHYLTVTFSDGTEKEIILSSEYVWTNVPSTAVLGERDADAIKPSSSWKFATNLYAEGTVTSRGNALFNGVYNADVYSETWTMGGNYYTEFDAEGKGTTTSGNTQLLAAPNDTVWFDFGAPLRMSGVRLHERTNNIVTAKVYGTDDIDGDATEWKLLGETKNNNAKTNTITFNKNYAYRYIKIQYALPTQVYTFLNEIAILAPKTLLSSDANVTVDVAEGDLAQFKFDQGASNSSPKKLIDEDRNAVHDYVTFDKGVLTFNNDFIKSLSDGAHKFQMTFTTGEEYILTVNKKDSSKVSYVLFSNNASGALVLESPGAKDVKSLKFADGTEIKNFTLSEDKKT